MTNKTKIEKFLQGDLIISVKESESDKIIPYIRKITNGKYYKDKITSYGNKTYFHFYTRPRHRWHARKCDCRDMVRHYKELLEQDRVNEIEKLKEEIKRLENK